MYFSVSTENWSGLHHFLGIFVVVFSELTSLEKNTIRHLKVDSLILLSQIKKIKILLDCAHKPGETLTL